METKLPTIRREQLLRRVRGEYLEMPGLRLTVAQAARLWNADWDECGRTLDALTRAGFLYRSKDQYLRHASAV